MDSSLKWSWSYRQLVDNQKLLVDSVSMRILLIVDKSLVINSGPMFLFECGCPRVQDSSVVSLDPLIAWTYYCSSDTLSTELHGHCIAREMWIHTFHQPVSSFIVQQRTRPARRLTASSLCSLNLTSFANRFPLICDLGWLYGVLNQVKFTMSRTHKTQWGKLFDVTSVLSCVCIEWGSVQKTRAECPALFTLNT